MSILLLRVVGSRWVVADPDGTLSVDDLAAEEVIPLVAGEEFPGPGRPFLIRDAVDETWRANLKVRARALADLHGAPQNALEATVVGAAIWLMADPAHPNFDKEVDVGAALAAGGFRSEGSAGLVREVRTAGTSWAFCERVMATDRETWLREKREGAGRDPRLTRMKATAWGHQPLFRDSVEHFVAEAPLAGLFEGPSCTSELTSSIATSGLEPLAFVEQFVSSTGLGPKSSVAIELRGHIFSLMLMGTVDRLNLGKSSAAEHISRRALQLMKAARRNPKSPDFETLEPYTRHMGPLGGGTVRTPTFDKFVTEVQKNEAYILKQGRLMQEEVAAWAKASSGPKKKNDKEDA